MCHPKHRHRGGQARRRCASVEDLQWTLTARPLVSLFPALPAPLQPHLIAAAVAQSNFTLSIPNFPHCPEAFIATLATTPLPAPGLRALALPKPSTSLICQHSKGYSTATAALLARAAAAHTTLATLDLSGTHLTGDWFVTFGNALTPSSLPHLRILWVSCHTLSGGAAELAALLQKLPALEDFAAYLGMVAHTADASDAMSCTHASVAPVVLPNLKCMHLRELLSLQRFRSAADLERGNASCAHFLLPLIEAPALTSLTFKLRCGSTVLPEFLSALREFTALREVRGHIPWHCDVTDVYSAFAPYALPAPHSVDLTSHCSVSPVPAAAALASYAGAALTRLSVSVVPRGPTDHVAPVPMEDAEDAWTALWEGVRHCGNLQELNLGNLRSLGPNRQAAEVFDSVARHLRPHLAPGAASLGA